MSATRFGREDAVVDGDEVAMLFAAENARLVEVLDGLDEAGWRTPTPCAGWTVRDVVVHLLMAYRLSIPRFLLGMVRTRFDFDRFAHRWAVDDPRTPGQARADLAATVGERFNVPGAPHEAPLSHLVCHAQDVARPLGVALDPAPRAAALTLDQLVGPRFSYLSEDLRTRITWIATDAGWSAGEGPEVRAPARVLVSVLTDRPEALDELEGEGVARVREGFAARG